MLRISFGAVVAASILSTSAFAKGVPPRAPAPIYDVPAFTWAGFYVGANVGAGVSSGGVSARCLATRALVENGPGCPIVPGRSLGDAGIIGGGSIGYNWQFARTIVGIEADVQGSSLDTRVSANGPFAFVQPFTIGPFTIPASPAGAMASARERMSVFGTVRARIGYTFDQMFVYVTGGAMIANLNLSAMSSSPAAFPLPASSFAPSYSGTQVGGIVGAGIEYKITDRLSGKVEALYYNLGTQTILSGEQNGTISGRVGSRFRTEGEIVRIGLNYKIDTYAPSPVVAKY